jgi:ATP-dependent Clp protease, protease subunit
MKNFYPKTNKTNSFEHFQQPLMGCTDTYLKLSDSRMIFLSEDITKKCAAELAALMLYYDVQDSEAPIYLHLHSNGGDVSALNNIIDVMSIVHCPVKTILLGKCYSAGAVILAAGTPGERYALPSARAMIHGIQFGFPLPGKDMTDNKSYTDFLKTHNDSLMKMLAKYTKQSLAKIKKDCEREMWMTAEEMVDFGLIDGIL